MRYQDSLSLILEAEAAERAGDLESARDLYSRAAAIQRSAFDEAADDKPRSRSIMGASVAALLLRAGEHAGAEQLACELLSQPWLESRSRHHLREILTMAWRAQAMEGLGLELAPRRLSLIFRGPDFHGGLAPTHVVDTAVRRLQHFVNRIAAMMARTPFTQRLSPELQQLYRPWQSPPLYGSYRIDLVFAEDPQLRLALEIGNGAPESGRLIDKSLEVLQLMRALDRDALRAEIPDVAYFGALMRLARLMLPTDHLLNEMVVETSSDQVERTVVLDQSLAQPFTKLLREPDEMPKQALVASRPVPLQEELTGVLRMVDLDQASLALTDDDGAKTPLSLGPDISEDVIGEYLNKRVIVLCRRSPRQKRLQVYDLEFAPAPDDPRRALAAD